ncbi:ankyrin repeat-containing domain protein [Hyaloscypha sp. PMI_1271]|nr:ankyrin repeat-containing domain protein [Hyaloscypha sp. PMI_1271]
MKRFRSKRGFGYLTASCRVGNTALVRALLALGASPNEISDSGHTPLHAAVAYGHHECAEIVLSHNADTEALMSSVLSSYYTPLIFACSSGDINITKLLLDNGANIWHRVLDGMQNTAAHLCANGVFPTSSACLQLLLKKDVRLALAKNSHQRTPLHHAAASGNVGSIKALLEAGADPNGVDVNGSNPLHTMEHLRPLEVVDLLLKAGADPHSRNLENSDAKSSAFLNLLIMLRLSPGDLFSSHSVAWSQTPFSPWYSSFPYRKPWMSPLSWFTSTPGQILVSDSSAKMWFLDVSPVSPLFGYYLSISLGKFHGQWNDAEIDISVCAWKRGSQIPRVRVQHTHSKAQRLLHFHPSIGKLITERNVLYNFNFGMVKIAEASDLMVEVKVKGATLSRGGLILGTVQFHLEPDFDLRAVNQIQAHPSLPDIQIIRNRDGEETKHIPELSLWYIFPRKISEFLILYVLVCFAITVRQDRWWRYVLILFVFNFAARDKMQRRAEIFPAWQPLSTAFGYGTMASSSRAARKDRVPWQVRFWLAVIMDQEKYLILIYCFFHDFRSAMLILAGHVACCFVARNQLANESSGFHVLCPLGLEMEVCLIIVFTQLGKAIFS